MAGTEFGAFKHTIERRFMQHPVVTKNEYTGWFSRGELSLDQVRHFTVQFSVFSNQFLLAALNRAINADSLQSARESKEILMNELGVIYNAGGKSEASDRAGGKWIRKVSDERHRERRKFRFEAAHFRVASASVSPWG